ncbi:MAG: glycosyltransferase [Gemmatimonadota bacterium]
MSGLRLLLLEPELGGHQADHLRHLVSFFTARRPVAALDLVVAPGFADAIEPHFRALLDDTPDVSVLPLARAEADAWMDPWLWRRSLRRWAIMRRWMGRLGPDHVHVLHLDQIQAPLAARRPVPGGTTLSGVLFRPSVHYDRFAGAPRPRPAERLRDARKRLLLRGALGHPALVRVFSLDPFFPDYAREAWGTGDRVAPLPDPVLFARAGGGPAETPFPPGRTGFLVFGLLQRRKGVLEALEAAARLDGPTARRVALLFGGRLEDGIRDEFLARLEEVRARAPDVWIELLDRRLPARELAALLAASDVVLAPYRRFVGSSGVLHAAAGAGKPVITQDYGLLGESTRRHGLGLAVDTTDPEAIAAAMRACVERGPAEIGSPEGRARYAEGKTPERFAEAVFEGIRAGRGEGG